MAKTKPRPPAADPLAAFGGEDAANDPLNDLLGGADTPTQDDTTDFLDGLGGDAPAPTAVPGMAGLRGAVSAQVVKESLSRGGAAGPDPIVAGALADIQGKMGKLVDLEAKLQTVAASLQAVNKFIDAVQKQLAAFDMKLDANSAAVLGALQELRGSVTTWGAEKNAEAFQKGVPATAPSKKADAANPIILALLPVLQAKRAKEQEAGRKFDSLPLANKAAVYGALSKQLAVGGITAAPEAVEKAFIEAGMVIDGAIKF